MPTPASSRSSAGTGRVAWSKSAMMMATSVVGTSNTVGWVTSLIGDRFRGEQEGAITEVVDDDLSVMIGFDWRCRDHLGRRIPELLCGHLPVVLGQPTVELDLVPVDPPP